MSSAKRSHLAGWLTGRGIELGALHQPLAVPAGVQVEYVDRLSVADLRTQYPELAALDLVPVSHIGSAEDLSSIADSSVDFVVACHVLEHLEDPDACAARRSTAFFAKVASSSVRCPSRASPSTGSVNRPRWSI